MAAAGWLADPTGVHELRYWDGSAWSEHVSDAGVTAADPLPADAPPPPPPADVPPPPPPPPGPASSGGGSWKDKLKGAAQTAAAQATQAAEKAKSAVSEQQAKREEQYANDPSILWHGSSKNPATGATGISKEHYRITKDKLWIESGLLGVTSQQVPLYAVKDIDVRQSVLQRGKDIGDVVLHLEDPMLGVQQEGWVGGFEHDYTAGTTSGQVVLDNVEGPYKVRELLAPLVSEARAAKVRERQTQHLHIHQEGGIPGVTSPPPAPAAAPAAPAAGGDLASKLRELAALRDEGILSDDEFAAQKAKLLES